MRNDKFYEAANNDEFQTYGKRRRYIENGDANEQSDVAQHFTNHDVNNIKNNRFHNEMLLKTPLNKRTFSSKGTQNEESELLFENNRGQASKVDKNDYFNEPIDQRSSYAKQYYNNMKPDKSMLDANSRDNDFSYYNRDRREAKKPHKDAENISGVDSDQETLEKSENENEKMAIKRHIKKMTGDELEKLLNSLSEEKKSLLKKIMDDDDVSDKSFESINKREITKKDGVIEDNGYIESGQSESSKLQGGFSALDITTAYPTAQGSDPTTTKQTENLPDNTLLCNQQKPSKETNTENKADLNGSIERNAEKSDNSFASDTDLNKDSAKIAPNELISSKNENKREVNTETMLESIEDSIIGSEDTKALLADENYYFPRDEDMSQFLDDVEQSRSYDSSKIYKRNVNVDDQSELDSKLKSLEESFPNSEAYHDSGPYSGPLIRVKRKNAERIMKKRSAAVLPDAKVGYYPYKSDNNDDDSDEGNEFDDDGFYDPTPNLVSNDNKDVDSNSRQAGKEASCKLNTGDQSKSSINDDSMNLGSDTDNVLSGVEGVDENLMFSGGSRNRRKTEASLVERVDENSLIQSEQSKTPNGDTKTVSTNNELNVPNYEDNDSFGGFPRSYEGDLGRYKRIRRVKQSHIPEAPSA